jgi:hypothetical protein
LLRRTVFPDNLDGCLYFFIVTNPSYSLLWTILPSCVLLLQIRHFSLWTLGFRTTPEDCMEQQNQWKLIFLIWSW